MINLYYFTDRNLKVGFKINLDSHHINHTNSELNITANYREFGIEVRNIIRNIKELSFFYVRKINPYIFKNQTVFSAKLDKQVEDIRVLDETELFINLKINHNLTQTDVDKTNVKSPIEHQIQQKGREDSGWRFEKIILMTIYFDQTGIMNDSTSLKFL